MARIDGLEQVLVTYPVNVSGGYTVVPGDGTTHFGLVLNADDPPGLHQGLRRHEDPPAERHVERPGQHRRPVHRAARERDVRARRPERAAPTERSGAYDAGWWLSEREADPLGAPASSYVAGYDPTSGLAYGAGQAPLVFGPSGGQAQAFGKDSWQWLLLSPLSK